MIKPIIDLSAQTLEYDTGKQAILEKYGKPSRNVTQVFAKRIAHDFNLMKHPTIPANTLN